MTTKVGTLVTYKEVPLLIKLHDPSIMWFCELTGQVK